MTIRLYQILVIITILLLASAVVAATESDTLEKLEEVYRPAETCGKCHPAIFEEWKMSIHDESLMHSLEGINAYVVQAMEKEPERKSDSLKSEIMKCLACHAPMVEGATEKLVKQIINDIKTTSAKNSDKEEKRRATENLSRLNVSCVICHNSKAVYPPGKPEDNTMYGPQGSGNTPYHKIKKATYIDNAVFCMQCHGVYTAPDMEKIICSTVAESYRDQYVSTGGQSSCQDCHMRKNNRGHSFPGAYVTDTLKEAITLTVNARAIKNQSPGTSKWIPSAAITIDLANNAGHRLPDGCMWTSKIVLDVTAYDDKDKSVWSAKKEFFEAGLDLNGNRRYDAWDVKDILDYTLQPRKTTTENYFAMFPEDQKLIKLEVKLTYIHKDDVQFTIHTDRRILRYE